MRASRRAFLFFSTAHCLCGQTKIVRIRVTDETGARIAGAEVTFINAQGEQVEILHTNTRGEASYSGAEFRNLQVTSPGMKRYLMVNAGTATSFDIVLGVSRVSIDWDGAPPPAIGRVRLRIMDADGRPLAMAHGWVPTGDERTVAANSSGDILFTGVTLGKAAFVISADGFPSRVVSAILRDGDEIALSVRLSTK